MHNTQNIQPTGVQVPGPKGAVMPNDSRVPANPTPTVDNTRADDTPIPKSIRGGLGVRTNNKVRKRIQKQKEDDRQDNAPLVQPKPDAMYDSDDDQPLVAPKAKAKTKARAKVSAIQKEKTRQSRTRKKQKEEGRDSAPLVQPKIKPVAMNDSDGEPLVAPKVNAKIKANVTAIQKQKARQSRTRKEQKEEDQDNAPLVQPQNKSAILIEEALPKPKQRAKVTANAKGDDAQNILRASKKAAARPTRRAERSIIADTPLAKDGKRTSYPTMYISPDKLDHE